MNVVSIIALIVILCLAGLGFKRGLIMSVWHLVSMIVILGVTIWLSPYVAKFAKGNEKIYGTFYSTMEKTVHVPVKSADEMDNFIKDFHLPEKAEKVVLDFASKYYGDAEDAQKSFADKVHEKLTEASLTALSFVITFGLVTLALTLIFKGLDLASKLPVINSMNKLGGIALGALEGLLIVWIAIGIVSLISVTPFGAKVVEQIQANKFLKVLYENNIVSTILSGRILAIFK